MSGKYKANFTVESVKPERFRDGRITRMVLQSVYDYADHCEIKRKLGLMVDLHIEENPEQLEIQGEAEEAEIWEYDTIMNCVKIESPAKKGGRVTVMTLESPYEYEDNTSLLHFIRQENSVRVAVEIFNHVEAGEPEEEIEKELDIN